MRCLFLLLLLVTDGLELSTGLQFDELETIVDQIVARPNECDYDREIHEIVPLADCQDSICSFPRSVCRYNLEADTWGCWKIPGECLKAIGDPLDDTGAIDPVDDDYPADDYFEDEFETTPTPRPQDLPTAEPVSMTTIEPLTTATTIPLRPAPFLPPLPSITVPAPVQIQPEIETENDSSKSSKQQKHSRQKIKAIRESLKAQQQQQQATISAKRKLSAKEGQRKLKRRQKGGQKRKRNKNSRNKNSRRNQRNNKNGKKRRKISRKLAKTKRARKFKLKQSKKNRKQQLKHRKRKSKRTPKDWHMWCCYWAAKGDCDSRNPTFMRPVCQQSCGTHTCTFSKFDTCTVNRHPQCTDPTAVLARMGAQSPPTRRPTAPKSVGKLKKGGPPRRGGRKSSLRTKFLPVIKQTKSLRVNNAKLQKKFRTFKIKTKDGKPTAFGKYLKRLSPFERYKLMLRVKAYKVRNRRKQNRRLDKNLKALTKLRRRGLKKSALKRKAVRLARIAKWQRKNAPRIRRLHRKLVSKVKTRARARSRLRGLRAKRLRRLRAARRKKRIVVQ